MSTKVKMTAEEQKAFRDLRGQATTPDSALAEAHRARERSEARSGAFTAKAIQRQRYAEKLLPTDAQRRDNALAGLRIYQKRLARDGDKRAGRVQEFVEAATSTLAEYVDMTARLTAPAADPVGDAARAAARELQKALPKCFAGEADAMLFASGLPLIEPRAAAVREADKRQAVDADRLRIGREFWSLVERACLAAGMGTDASAIRRLTDMAMT